MTMTSTYDHRVIQGAESGSFLRRVEQLLQGEDGFYEQVFRGARPRRRAGAPRRHHGGGARACRGHAGRGSGGGRRAAPGSAGRHLDRQGLPDARPSGRPARPARRRAGRGSRARPRDREPHTRADGPHPGLGAARGRAGGDVRRGAAPAARHLHRHDRLRDRAHLRPRPAHLAAAGDRVGHLPQGARARGPSGRCSSGCPRSRRSRATCTRPSWARSSSRSRASTRSCRCSTRRSSWRARRGARDVILGMAHRGRLNVLAHTVGRPYESILVEFEGEQSLAADTAAPEGGTGDVKYHYGASGTYQTRAGRPITVSLSHNPSHLEYVNPVIEGRARADQTGRKAAAISHDPTRRPADPDPRRRRLPRPGDRVRDAQPPGARRLLDGRHAARDRQQPARLHDRSGGGALHPLRLRPRQGLRHPDHPRERRRRGGLHQRRPAGDGLPADLQPGRAHRPDRLPPLRPQRDRRAGLHPAADVRADQEAPARPQALRGPAGRRGRGVRGRTRRAWPRPPTSAWPTRTPSSRSRSARRPTRASTSSTGR